MRKTGAFLGGAALATSMSVGLASPAFASGHSSGRLVISQTKLQNAIAAYIDGKGITTATASCPKNEPDKAGRKFHCTVTYADQSKTDILVTVMKGRGNVQWRSDGPISAAPVPAVSTPAPTTTAPPPPTTTVPPAPTTTVPPPPANTTIVLDSTGPADDLVLYGPEGSQNEAAGDVSQTYTVANDGFGNAQVPFGTYYAISANLGADPGETGTCSITVNGQVITQHSAVGGEASCQIGYFEGSWQVES